jgi:hypothetical protein
MKTCDSAEHHGTNKQYSSTGTEQREKQAARDTARVIVTAKRAEITDEQVEVETTAQHSEQQR